MEMRKHRDAAGRWDHKAGDAVLAVLPSAMRGDNFALDGLMMLAAMCDGRGDHDGGGGKAEGQTDKRMEVVAMVLTAAVQGRQVEMAERFSRLPALTPEQWCWFQKREHDREALERSAADLLTIALLLWNKGEREESDPLMEETFRYWVSASERVAEVWRKKLRKEEGR